MLERRWDIGKKRNRDEGLQGALTTKELFVAMFKECKKRALISKGDQEAIDVVPVWLGRSRSSLIKFRNFSSCRLSKVFKSLARPEELG